VPVGILPVGTVLVGTVPVGTVTCTRFLQCYLYNWAKFGTIYSKMGTTVSH